ncbi:lipid-binding SYLF domain-containing protein [Acetobacter oeni]|uniref:Ysc84 actin-binding domain-containing protein n=1 Tax=Acetobacter oeni TaxID=304077 RepID=A0A511XHD0_9PROT|nr:lipid-binding SYLF domain-containing protein [Acetobacter oeni]MBB3881195.1 lipid-binding SYLF domain-containing protein [Acetobacter oeni]NHO18071.1 hypothetical protein [Acetobacter oeni]GBR08404.1 hypothetical protein AA21952_2608 [Acetobacter oeni LMG 21952]GEN62347.1 hypothetical protein AOE01nite_05710 [Acetobacter oeni]
MRARRSFRLSIYTAAALTTAVAGLFALPAQSRAASNETQQTLVDKATLAVQDIFIGAKTTDRVYRYLGKSRAVMVCPSVFRMSIGIGGSGGGCVLMSRDARGSWSDPAFYRLGSASLGFQLGVQSSEIIFFVMTDRGLQALLDSQFQFGANANASFATLGGGIESGTAGRSNTDIMAIQKSSGVFAGVSLGGSKLTVDSDANRAYYNQIVGPEEIVVSMRVNNTAADPLREILTRYSTSATAAEATTSTGAAGADTSGTGAGMADGPTSLTPSTSSGSGAIQSQSLPPVTSGKHY